MPNKPKSSAQVQEANGWAELRLEPRFRCSTWPPSPPFFFSDGDSRSCGLPRKQGEFEGVAALAHLSPVLTILPLSSSPGCALRSPSQFHAAPYIGASGPHRPLF